MDQQCDLSRPDLVWRVLKLCKNHGLDYTPVMVSITEIVQYQTYTVDELVDSLERNFNGSLGYHEFERNTQDMLELVGCYKPVVRKY